MAKTWILGVALAAIVLGTFAPAMNNNFVGYDDPEYVIENPHVNTGLSGRNLRWAFTAAHSSNWHPFTWISHAIDSSLFGLDPWGHHLVNVLFHVANSVLLFVWLNRATGFAGRSAFVAAVFGLHPLHVESVAWVAERKDVLSTFFWMLTLLAYSGYVKYPGKLRYAVVALCLTAGLLAKQMLVTVPLLLLCLDWWPLRRFWKLEASERKHLRQLLIEKLPLFALSVIACAAALWAQTRGGSIAQIEQLPVPLRLANAVVSYTAYLLKTVWPVDLAVFYPFPIGGILAWKIVASVLAVTVTSAAAIMLRSRYPWFFTGWSWYILTLLPVIGIVQIGMQAMADRYMYVPMIGILIALTWACCEISHKWQFAKRVLPVAGSLVLVACAYASRLQIGVWKDGTTLFTHTLGVTENNFVAHNNLGVELDRTGKLEDALLHYREALRIKPGYAHAAANYANAQFVRGERLFRSGDLDAALTALQEGFRYRPSSATAHVHAGMILTQKQQLPAAIAEFQRAIAIEPSMAQAHMGLGVAYAWTGQAAEAKLAFEQTVRHDPANAEAHYNLGLILAATGRNRDALRHFDQALKLKPGFNGARIARAELLRNSR